MPDTPDPDPVTKVIGALRTAVDELARLAEHPTVKSVLGGLVNALSPSEPAAPAPAGPPAEAPAAAKPATGRRAQLLELVGEQPGITIPAAAKHLGISPGGLYPVARKLEAEGLIRKDGAGWHPTGG